MSKLIKIIVAVCVLFVATLLVVAALIPSQYHIEKSIVISKNKDEVFNYIKHIKNQSQYSAWARLDPDMKQTFSGTDGQVGFISAWESANEKVGKGEQEITKIVEGERIETQLRFLEPFEATDSSFLSTESASENQTKVTWGFSGNFTYPMNLMLLVMDMDKQIGVYFEQGLAELKTILEDNTVH